MEFPVAADKPGYAARVTATDRVLVGTVCSSRCGWWRSSRSRRTNGSSEGLGQYQSAINAAHNAVKVSNGAAAAQGSNLATPSAAPAHSGTATAAAGARPLRQPRSRRTPRRSRRPRRPNRRQAPEGDAAQPRRQRASPPPRDRDAVLQPGRRRRPRRRPELATVPRHNGRVVKLAVPISEVSAFR